MTLFVRSGDCVTKQILLLSLDPVSGSVSPWVTSHFCSPQLLVLLPPLVVEYMRAPGHGLL